MKKFHEALTGQRGLFYGERYLLEDRLYKELARVISPPRLKHSLDTRDVAVELAQRYGLEEQRVMLAALLHDCARELGDERLMEYALQEGIPIGETEQELPVFLHGPVGAVMVRKNFGVHDLQVLRAISVHTTGAAKMGSLEKVVFIADKIEPGRKYPGVDRLRELAFYDLDKCLVACLDQSVKFSLERGVVLHPEICRARNSALRGIMRTSP